MGDTYTQIYIQKEDRRTPEGCNVKHCLGGKLFQHYAPLGLGLLDPTCAINIWTPPGADRDSTLDPRYKTTRFL